MSPNTTNLEYPSSFRTADDLAERIYGKLAISRRTSTDHILKTALLWTHEEMACSAPENIVEEARMAFLDNSKGGHDVRRVDSGHSVADADMPGAVPLTVELSTVSDAQADMSDVVMDDDASSELSDAPDFIEEAIARGHDLSQFLSEDELLHMAHPPRKLHPYPTPVPDPNSATLSATRTVPNRGNNKLKRKQLKIINPDGWLSTDVLISRKPSHEQRPARLNHSEEIYKLQVSGSRFPEQVISWDPNNRQYSPRNRDTRDPRYVIVGSRYGPAGKNLYTITANTPDANKSATLHVSGEFIKRFVELWQLEAYEHYLFRNPYIDPRSIANRRRAEGLTLEEKEYYGTRQQPDLDRPPAYNPPDEDNTTGVAAIKLLEYPGFDEYPDFAAYDSGDDIPYVDSHAMKVEKHFYTTRFELALRKPKLNDVVFFEKFGRDPDGRLVSGKKHLERIKQKWPGFYAKRKAALDVGEGKVKVKELKGDVVRKSKTRQVTPDGEFRVSKKTEKQPQRSIIDCMT